MKNYGKRKIPRDIWEFEDLIGPSFYAGDYSRSADILLSFWKRKGQSKRSAGFITSGLFACSFKGNINIDGRFILEKYFIGTSDFIYDNYDEFIPYFFDRFINTYKSVPQFLKRFYISIEWKMPIDLIEKYQPKSELKKIAPREINFNRGWNYGLKNNRIDIMSDALISFELKQTVEEATKEFRVNKGLSPVATQWIGEQYLLDKIKTTFPKEIVIGQGSPKWLEGQRFDIWLPEHNVAVEYNGKQHYEPVKIFGGIEGFEATRLRDELKRKKCAGNNVELLEVREGYKFNTVKGWIESKIYKTNPNN